MISDDLLFVLSTAIKGKVAQVQPFDEIKTIQGRSKNDKRLYHAHPSPQLQSGQGSVYSARVRLPGNDSPCAQGLTPAHMAGFESAPKLMRSKVPVVKASMTSFLAYLLKYACCVAVGVMVRMPPPSMVPGTKAGVECPALYIRTFTVTPDWSATGKVSVPEKLSGIGSSFRQHASAAKTVNASMMSIYPIQMSFCLYVLTMTALPLRLDWY
jgi:hypothetical protein